MNHIKKTYSYINLTKRVNFLIKVLCEKNSVREASKLFNIKFSTGKAILKLFKQEGRIGKPNSIVDNDLADQEEMLKKIVQLETTIKKQKNEKKQEKLQELAQRLTKLSKEEQKIETKTDLSTTNTYYQDLAQQLSQQVEQEQAMYNQLMSYFQFRNIY